MSSFLLRRATAAPRAVNAFSTTQARGFARITVMGHLGAAPELQATSTGTELIKYAVASSSGPKDNRTTSWFRVTSFAPAGPQRDFIMSLPKG